MRLLAEIELFSELARLRNFGRAATALGVTAPTLSRRVAALERELGVSLIRRSTRSFALTESGEKLLEHAQNILDRATRARDELQAGVSKLTGHLRAGAPADLVCTILTPALAHYCRENTGVSLSITSTQGQPDLVRDSLDVAFTVAHQARLADSPYTTHPVGSFARMLYASKAYLEQKGTPTEPQELQHHDCIRHVSGTAEKYWELHCGKRRQPVAIAGVCESTSVIVGAQAAREHLGIAMLPQHLATHPAFGAGLSRVLPAWEGTPAYVLAITADRTLSARTQEAIRIVRQEFRTRLAQLEAAGTEPL